MINPLDLSNKHIEEITFLCVQKYNDEHVMLSYDWIRKNTFRYLELYEIKFEKWNLLKFIDTNVYIVDISMQVH